jgi:hypothetical protein
MRAASRCVFLAIAGLPGGANAGKAGTQAMRRHRGVAGQAPYAPSLLICGFTSVRVDKRQRPCSLG